MRKRHVVSLRMMGLLGLALLLCCGSVGRAEALGEREAQIVDVLAADLVEVLVDGVVKPMLLEGLGLPEDLDEEEEAEGRDFLLSRLGGRTVFIEPVAVEPGGLLRGYLWLERPSEHIDRDFLLRANLHAILLSHGYAFLLNRRSVWPYDFVLVEREAQGRKVGWWKDHGHGKGKPGKHKNKGKHHGKGCGKKHDGARDD